jgi:hypothetical protein
LQILKMPRLGQKATQQPTGIFNIHLGCLIILSCLQITPAAARVQAPASPVDSLLSQYAQLPHATAYGNDLVAALQSMDADLVQSTAPLLRTLKNSTVPVYPIGFSIPPEYVRAVVPAKAQALVTVIPGHPSTYKFKPRPDSTPAKLAALEREYYADMERSLFGLTWKKAGWDCMRHLELLAAGCTPLFTDVEAGPVGAVAFLPKRVLAIVLRFPGVEALAGVPGSPSGDGILNVTINMPRVDPILYSLTVTALLEYTRRHLTTPAMAAHLLATMGIQPPSCFGDNESTTVRRSQSRSVLRRWRLPALGHMASYPSPTTKPACRTGPIRVLHLSSPDYPGADYMTDTLVHGLVSLLGPDSVTQYPRREVLYTTPALLYETKRAPARASQYGIGFSYANTLFDMRDTGGLEPADAVSTANAGVRAAIAAREFDVIIFGQVHRGPPPLVEAACKLYTPSKIAAVHGGHTPPSNAELQIYAACAGYYFAREA